LLAVTVTRKLPTASAAGDPEIVAVPLPLSTKARPAGRVPVSVRAGAGKPVVVIVNVRAVPARRAVNDGLVIAGPATTVTVAVSVADRPPEAVSVARTPTVYVPGASGTIGKETEAPGVSSEPLLSRSTRR